jgi:AraC-like DNA-binding protein
MAPGDPGGGVHQESVWPVDSPDDVLLFPRPVMGMAYDNFDSILTDVLRSQPAVESPSSSRHGRLDSKGRGVRDFINPQEGRGYSDYFKISDTLCISVTDFQYLRNTWINVAGSGLMKLRLVLSGRLLSESGAVLGKASEVIMDISPGSSQTGYYVAANERTRIVCLHCRPQYLTEVMGLNPAELPSPLKRFFTQEKTLERLKMVPNAKAMQAARQIAESRGAMAPPLRAPYMEALSTQILLHVFSALGRQRPASADSSFLRARDLKKISEARDYLTRHFVSPPRICDLARMVGVNQTKLKAGFRKLTGMAVYQYVVSCRMQRAAHLLATHDYDVAEVAFKVGYAHPTNFTHAFKHYHGTLPHTLTSRSRT